jgi:heme exporter protein B
MSAFAAILTRDLRLNAARIALPVSFFLLVATLYPFAVGPDAVLLGRTGAGIAWVAALLAALLPVERLIAPDAAAGMLDQYAVRGISEELVAAAKLVAHWLAFAPALMLACVPAAALLAIDGTALAQLELGLFLGTPGLAALGVTTAALTASSRGGSALTGLVMLPLAVPLLIFGAGGGLKLLAATSLLLVAVAPFAAGAAIRAART